MSLNSKQLFNPAGTDIKRRFTESGAAVDTTAATMIQLTTGSNHNQSVAIMAILAD